MLLIVIIIIAIYVLAIVWSWNSLGDLEKTRKVLGIASRNHSDISYHTYLICYFKKWSRISKYSYGKKR